MRRRDEQEWRTTIHRLSATRCRLTFKRESIGGSVDSEILSMNLTTDLLNALGVPPPAHTSGTLQVHSPINGARLASRNDRVLTTCG